MRYSKLIYVIIALTTSFLGVQGAKVKCTYTELVSSGLEGDNAKDHKDTKQICLTKSYETYKLVGLNKKVKKSELVSGSTELILKNVKKSGNEIKITKKSKVKKGVKKTKKKKKSTTGINSALAVRIVANDAETTTPEDELSDEMFGTFGDPYNMKSQFDACSYGAFQTEPYSGVTVGGEEISNGVYTSTISTDVTGVNVTDTDFLNDLLTQLNDVLGDINQIDHLMICYPPGTLSDGLLDWGVVSFLGSNINLFDDLFCNYPSAQIFGVGGNLFLAPAIGDRTGGMGPPSEEDDGPVRCFNGVNSWLLGWYPNGEVSIDPTAETFEGDLVGVANYDKLEMGQTTVLQLTNSVTGDNYYISFNHAVGINSGTLESPNLVLITAEFFFFSFSFSFLEANLTANSNFDLLDFEPPITVSVGEISLETGIAQVSLSNAITSAPTQAPSFVPNPSNCENADDFQVLVSITTDEFPEETSWNITTLETNEIIIEGGPYAVPLTTFTELACLSGGTYVFTIGDTFGDGICCFQGAGNYKIFVDGKVAFSGGDFDFVSTHVLKLGGGKKKKNKKKKKKNKF